EIQHARPWKPRIHDAHPSLANPIAGRPYTLIDRRVDTTSAPFPGDDPHSDPEVGQPALQPRLSVPFIPLEPIRDIHSHPDVELFRAWPHSPPDHDECTLVVGEGDFQPVLAHDARRRRDDESARHEQRRWIADAARL